MPPSILFNVGSSFVLVGWIILIFAPHWKHSQSVVLYGIVGILCLAYAFLILPTLLHFEPDAFSTLENVRALFQNDAALVAGWMHYLAFDLFVGAYLVREGQRRGMARWMYTVCLPFTFMFGPLGLLLFYLISLYVTKNI